jgi:hypothetical protein
MPGRRSDCNKGFMMSSSSERLQEHTKKSAGESEKFFDQNFGKIGKNVGRRAVWV